MSPRRDSQRGAVYAAEADVRTLFSRAAERGGTLDFFGAALTLPPEARFADVSSVRRHVEAVFALPAVAQRWSGAIAPTVRARRGTAAAHWTLVGGESVIAVPEAGDRWALRELVVLHEVAHHLARADPPHGPTFTATMRELTGMVMGPEAGFVLTVVHGRHGVR